MQRGDWTVRIVLMALIGVLGTLVSPPQSPWAAEPKTGKERLSDKASDEQRMDNCGVPPERRGSKPRPDCKVTDTAAKKSPRRNPSTTPVR